MPRANKYDDIPFEQFISTGKFFIYCSPNWKILYPFVDIIRLFKKNSIIQFRYGKGQNHIHTYGLQYNHRVIGSELKTKQDYLNLQRSRIKCFFIFSDSSDPVATNLLKCAEQFKVNAICYSNLDNVYHFYSYFNELVKKEFKTPEEVMEMVYLVENVNDVQKINNLFPELEILENVEVPAETTLEKCLNALKISTEQEKVKKEKMRTVIYDPHIAKLKKMEYERAQKKIVYDDNIEDINKHLKKETSLSSFFKKK